jgi:hypothetical protein
MAPEQEPVSPLPSKRWIQFHAALQLAIQRAAHKWTSVFVLSLALAIFTKSFYSLVLKSFPSVSLSGVRNNPTVQRVSSKPSQPLSKTTSLCVPFPVLLSSIHTLSSEFSILPCNPSLPFPPARVIVSFLHSSLWGWEQTQDQYKQVVRGIRGPKELGYFAPSGDRRTGTPRAWRNWIYPWRWHERGHLACRFTTPCGSPGTDDTCSRARA